MSHKSVLFFSIILALSMGFLNGCHYAAYRNLSDIDRTLYNRCLDRMTVAERREYLLDMTSAERVELVSFLCPDPSRNLSCCKYCSTGKPCGDSCIARDKVCHKPVGCACAK